MTNSNDDRDDHDDQDQDSVDDIVDVDVDEELTEQPSISLSLGDRDDDTAHLMAWAKLFTRADSESEAMWEALRRWVWTQTDFASAVADEDIPPNEKNDMRVLHTRAAVDRVNETRLRTMSDLAIAKELGVYADYYDRKTGTGDEAYRRVAYHLSQAQQVLEDYHDYKVTRPSEQDDTPDTE